MKKLLVEILIFCLVFSAYSQSPQTKDRSKDLMCDVLQNPLARKTTTLNGKWHYIVDQYETAFYDYHGKPRDESKTISLSNGFQLNYSPKDKTERVEYNFDLSPTMIIPGDWNTHSEKLFHYEGSIWFKKSFEYKKDQADNRVFIHFGAANYRSDVYINGKKAGMHEGGFTPFFFEITDLLKTGENFVVVRVNNTRKKENIPALNADWFNYGGITRDVSLIETHPVFIKDYKLQLKPGDLNTASGYVLLDGETREKQKVSVSIPELGIQKVVKTDESGMAEFEIELKDLTLWNPENPKLYDVVLEYNNEQILDKIGFRTVSVKGKDILLNGKPVFLRGISIHEENPLRGNRSFCKEDAYLMLNWVRELGCNFVRLAHYPHNDYMIHLADEMGIMVWCENPVYWNILFENQETYEKASCMMSELISRDKNRASVIIWSVGNETPVGHDRNVFLGKMIRHTKAMDNTRLVSAALEVTNIKGKKNTSTISDPLADSLDILSFNEYIGWYHGLPDLCSRMKWEIKQNKPVIISEFGGGALQGYHADSLTRWTEEYQEYLYRESLQMLETIPQLRGMSPWILADFRSPKRFLPFIQDGWNRKGLISENGVKKKAFYTLQKYYQEKEKSFK